MNTSTQRSRDYAASLGVSLAVLAGELPPPAADGSADPWIKVTPRGSVRTRDGRAYSFDPEKLADRFKSDGVDLPADFDHGIAINAIKGVKTPAVGWATDLQARPEGTYAKMDWLPEAKAAMADRTHRYVSPTFMHDAGGNATWLHSISLTAAPALSMPAVASVLASEGSASGTLATLAAALGLPEAADGAALLAAIGALRDGTVPKNHHETALAALTASTKRLTALEAKARAETAAGLVEEALKAKKIVPFQRDIYTAMCATDAGLEMFRSLMASTIPMLQASGLDHRQVPGADKPGNPRDMAAKASAYREKQRQAGFDISHSDAVRALTHE